jgi:hypothetical protein
VPLTSESDPRRPRHDEQMPMECDGEAVAGWRGRGRGRGRRSEKRGRYSGVTGRRERGRAWARAWKSGRPYGMLRSATMRKAGGVVLAAVWSSRIGRPISAAGLGIRYQMQMQACSRASSPHHRPTAHRALPILRPPTSCILYNPPSDQPRRRYIVSSTSLAPIPVRVLHWASSRSGRLSSSSETAALIPARLALQLDPVIAPISS